MSVVIPTRSELLERRRRVALAVQGRDLLRDKRTALLRAFAERSQALLERLRGAEDAMGRARAILDEASVAVGVVPLESAALAGRPRLGVEVSASVVAGVAIVDLEHDPVVRTPAERGLSPTCTDAVIDAVAAAYETAVSRFLGLAALELTVRRLAAEIARTTRQVNALDHVLIPRLQEEARRITTVLEEREREELARLRRARSNRSSVDVGSTV
ncbi:V-type ATP synthase subunit D [Mycobacterium antarcticum]|uniref:V-type ATP synthase subunit D n=1 Tax=Mycolicibacterium sp. TUM20983 TaxID=3023369 RepID=UPI0023930C20|nr:V-type ATP synthase subunit D [Mycolicibacterium sp. TUM20983]GLP76604.1 V-type ATP synthase subunit D [Mycolicibacterium sp. TUM20983]